jgi:hypothetical protein
MAIVKFQIICLLASGVRARVITVQWLVAMLLEIDQLFAFL